MKVKRVLCAVLTLIFCLSLTLVSCGGSTENPTTAAPETTTPATTTSPATKTPTATPTEAPSTTAEPTETEVLTDPTEEIVVYPIVFSDKSIDLGESGAAAEGTALTITKPGSYELSGTCSNGSVVVKVEKTEQVELILAGLNLTNPTAPAIWCDSADKLFITVKEGTTNTVSDGKNYTNKTDGPNAAIYSDDDLTIRGEGTLNVLGKFKNGVSSKNDIKIKEVTLNVTSYNTGIRGKGSVQISSGVITVDAGNDGLKATEENKDGKGFVEISGGTVTIVAGDDGIQAATTATLSGGVVKVTAEGKQVNAPTQDIAAGVLK